MTSVPPPYPPQQPHPAYPPNPPPQPNPVYQPNPPYPNYPMPPALPACPKCGQSDQVQPVPFVYSLGRLELAPPQPPRTEAPWETWAIVTTAILGALLLCSLFGTLTEFSYNDLLPVAFFFGLPGMLILTGFLLVVIASQVRRMRGLRIDATRKQGEWQRALVRWQHMLYCRRDDGVFLPPDSAFESVKWMKSLLYK